MSVAATGTPEVAVVVGAFGRRTYVRDAVGSVLAQSLPRERFEVVVLKDFADPDLDRWLAEEGVRTVLDREPRIGRWLLHAVRATRAPWVAFLDDDDEFEPERLARVVEVGRAHPEVGFYRNRVLVIDAEGRRVDPHAWRPIERDAAFDRTGPILVRPTDKADLAALVLRTTHASFNSSTVAVRRELLEGPFGAAFESTQLPDLALLVAAAVAPCGLYLDDRRLTRFRHHGQNVTREVEWLRHAVESHANLAAVAGQLGRSDFADRLRATSQHYDRVYRTSAIVAAVRLGSPRDCVAGLTAGYLRFLGAHPDQRELRPDAWVAGVYAALYCLWPGLGRRVALARFRPRWG